MLLPNAWFSKIGLLAVGALLWGGGAQAAVALSPRGASLESLSKEPLFQCVKERFYSCFVQYYALPTDLSGELVETGRDGQNIPLSDNPRGSEVSPRLEKVAPILNWDKLGSRLNDELKQLRYIPTGNVEVDAENKERVAQRWAAFAFMLKRLDPARVWQRYRFWLCGKKMFR